MAAPKKPAARKTPRVANQHAISLSREDNALLRAICRREGFDPADFLQLLVSHGLQRWRLPFDQRPDIVRIMALIRRYRSPLELRVEHWRYQEPTQQAAQEEQPALRSPAATPPDGNGAPPSVASPAP